MRSSNVLLYPGQQYNQPAAYAPANYARSADVKRGECLASLGLQES